MLSEAYIGLGSNLGDRAANIRLGLEALRRVSRHVQASSLYETDPVGFQGQPPFLNAVCRIWTRLTAFELLAEARRAQAGASGARPFPNGPRALDIDILLYGRAVLDTPGLTIPHPRMMERPFVLRPLAEIAPGLAHPVKVVRLGESHALGSVLNAATAQASGTLLAKMDDDDVYGAEHLWDLVLAHEYSGAALVGKFPATVYLSRPDRTVRRRRVRSETWSRSITGGAMLIARSDLDRAGGWRRVRRHEDEALIDDVLRVGGGVYRTHDAGYVLVRHGEQHTWETDDADFLAQAEAVYPGWHPALAGIEDAPPPPGPADGGPER